MIGTLTESVFRLLQQRLLFQPAALPAGHRYDFPDPFEELFLDTPDGQRLNALFFPAAGPSRGVVLYFHGNRGNLQRWGGLHRDFTPRGHDFFAIDYRGYGKNAGTPDELTLRADARVAYDFLSRRYAPEQIVLYGRSLGSGMASYLAAHVPARGLVLETPFDNLPSLIRQHLRLPALPFHPAYSFPNDRFVKLSSLPILLFHGTRDRVVPFACADNLRACLKPGDRFVTVPGGAHNNLREFPIYQEELENWLQ